MGSTPLYVVAVLAAVYFAYRWALPKPIPGIPYDESAKNSLFGNLPEIWSAVRTTRRLAPFLVEHPKKHKSALTQIWLGPFQKPRLILSDPRESSDMLLRRFREFDHGQVSVDAFNGMIPNHHIAMYSSDPRFKGNREIIRDLMTPKFLHEVSAPQIYAKMMTLIELWTLKTELSKSQPFSAHRDIFEAAFDMISAAAFGLEDDQSTIRHQLDFLKSKSDNISLTKEGDAVIFPEIPTLPILEAIEGITNHIGDQVKSPYPKLMNKYELLTNPTLVKQIARKNKFIQDQIDKAVMRLRTGENVTRSAMDHILRREMNAAKKEDREPIFHSPRVHDELFGYIVAGHDTSSNTLLWMLKNIADYPEVQTELREALHSAYPEAHANGAQQDCVELSKTSVPYLDAVIEESLRYEGPFPVTSREAIVPCELLGHKIPKGTQVFLLSDGAGFQSPCIPIAEHTRSLSSREKSMYGSWDPSNMHLFAPERWLKLDESGNVVYDPLSGPMMAFSLGPRGCFGKRLAYLEIRIVLALLVWNFEFHKLSDELSSREAYDTLTKNPRQCFVSLTKII
ncbi:cytochrome P450 [Astrocystis sublimbata]|nr:cytochrome P450 [Astrocystis sublimbata]